MFIRNNRLFLLLIILCFFFIINIGYINADERTKNLQSVVLEDFELGEGGNPNRSWIAIPNRFGREENLEAGKSLQKLTWIESWPEAYFGRDGKFDDGNGLKDYKNCLALWMAFNRQGYNLVELYPLEKKDDGKFHKSPIEFRGRVKQIDLWVWGANYDYDVELVLMDYRGIEFRLPVGKIKHIGWKNFVVPLPNYIPQSVSHIPSLKNLSLIKIVIWTNPKEKVTGAYVYIDHIKYLTDIFESKYDGYNLGEDETVNNLWEKGPKAPEESELADSITENNE